MSIKSMKDAAYDLRSSLEKGECPYMITEYIQNGGDVNFNFSFMPDVNFTLLHEAAFFGRYESIERLIQHKANINSLYIGKITPLFDAISKDRVECVKLLLKLGADYRIIEKTDNYSSMIEFAKYKGFLEIVQILEEHEACQIDVKAVKRI